VVDPGLASPIRAADGDAPGGRLIVIWKDRADVDVLNALSADQIKSETTMVGGELSLVVASAGRPG